MPSPTQPPRVAEVRDRRRKDEPEKHPVAKAYARVPLDELKSQIAQWRRTARLTN